MKMQATEWIYLIYILYIFIYLWQRAYPDNKGLSWSIQLKNKILEQTVHKVRYTNGQKMHENVNIVIIREMQIKTVMPYHYIASRMAKI